MELILDQNQKMDVSVFLTASGWVTMTQCVLNQALSNNSLKRRKVDKNNLLKSELDQSHASHTTPEELLRRVRLSSVGVTRILNICTDGMVDLKMSIHWPAQVVKNCWICSRELTLTIQTFH